MRWCSRYSIDQTFYALNSIRFDSELDPPVTRTVRRGVVRCNRSRSAVADRLHAGGWNTGGDQSVDNGLRPPLGQRLITLVDPLRVGVTFDVDDHIWAGQCCLSQLFECRIAAPVECRARPVELDDPFTGYGFQRRLAR